MRILLPMAVLSAIPLAARPLAAEGQSMRLQPGGPARIDAERFDIVAQASGNLPPSPPSGPPGPAQLMLQRLLGLKLLSVRASVDVLVIDSAPRPTEN